MERCTGAFGTEKGIQIAGANPKRCWRADRWGSFMVRGCTTGKGVEVGRSGAVSRRAHQKKTRFAAPRQIEPPPQRAVCARFHHAVGGRSNFFGGSLLRGNYGSIARLDRWTATTKVATCGWPLSSPFWVLTWETLESRTSKLALHPPPPETNNTLLSRWEGEGEGGTTTEWPAPRGTGRTQQTVA